MSFAASRRMTLNTEAGMVERLSIGMDATQGTLWAWLLGPFALAHLRVYNDPERAAQFVDSMANHLNEHGLGSVSEILDGDPPFRPRGCIAQAWSVAEVLHAWTIIAAARRAIKPGRAMACNA